MNLTYTRPGELRKPDVEVLPDGRIRITRYIAAGHGDRDYSEVTESVGTTDLGLGTALLVKRGMARVEGKDAIVKTYEVRNAETETKVGLEDVQYGENGLKTVIADWVQMSSGTYTPQTVGTTASTYDDTCILRNEVMEDDGTTRQIRRVYINKGLLLETNETKNNGALLLKTLVYLNDAPSPNPPTGYTLISTRVENPNGLETTTYTFAKGNGQISQDDETKNNGSLLIRTIRHLSAPSVSSNPIATPSGYTNVSYGYSDQDGYRLWTAVYAKGTGQISQDDEIKNNGALLIRTIRYLTDSSVTANPIATPTGYTNVSYSYSDQDGYRVWTASYAKGNGKISESSETRLNGALLRSTIVWLTDPSVTTQPTSDPLSGGNIVSQEYADRDGYRVWTVVWAKGVSTSNIVDSIEYRNDGKLVVYKRQRLNAAPSTPAPTIGGTVVLIESDTQLQDGYTLYGATWAEGVGEVTSSTDTKNNGALSVKTIRYLASPSTGANPISTPSGYTLISETYSEESGYRVWSASYAKGTGQISLDEETRNNGALLIQNIRYISTPSISANPIVTPSGYINISSSYVSQDGHKIWTASYAKGNGAIGTTTESRNNGALLVETTRYLSAPSVSVNPIATPSGYTSISSSYADQEGHRVWTASFAKGDGKVSQSNETRFSGAFLKDTIVWLTSPSVSTQPTTDPLGGGTIISEEYSDRDGHRVWTVVWAKGVATNNTIETVDYRNKGKLVIYTRQRLNSAPATPASTISGTVVLIEQNTRLEDGYTLYSATWAEGKGTINSSQDVRNQGKLLIYQITSLAEVPTTPSASIGGSVVLISDNSRDDNGVTIYDRRWAEGKGVIEKRTQPRDGGLRIETWVSLGQSYDGAFMLPAGVLMAKDSDDIDGVTRWTVSCMQNISGGDPTSGVALSYATKRPFQYPGRAKAIATSATLLGATRTSFDIYQSPPVDAMVDAAVKVTYQTSSSLPALTYTLWNPTEWATIQAFYLAWNQYPKFVNQTLPRYRAISGTQTFNGGGVSGYQQTCLGERVYGIGSGTPYYLTVSGGPSAPDGNTYTIEMPTLEPAFISYSGTQYYRAIIVEATIPAQPPLPV